MEFQVIEYRQASFKKRMKISKRFMSFYFKQFKPLTNLEANDVDSAKSNYNLITLSMAIFFGLLSHRIRKSIQWHTAVQHFYQNLHHYT